MKNVLTFFFVLLPFTLTARDITVPLGQKISTYAAQANAGDRLLLQAGTYEDQDYITLKAGISVKGAGKDRTLVKVKQWAWYTGFFNLRDTPGSNGNIEISDMTLDGQNVSWSAVRNEELGAIKIHDIIIRNFYRSAIELVGYKSTLPLQNIEIYNFLIENSSNENNSSANGNIQAYGFLNNIMIHHGTIIHNNGDELDDPLIPQEARGFGKSGYAIKFQETYDADNGYQAVTGKITNSRFYALKMVAKATSKFNGGYTPTINFEFFNIETENIEISDCDFNSALSLEKENSRKPALSAYVRNNRFKVIQGVSSVLEIALSNVVVEDNEFNWLENKVTNVWGAAGQYNGKTTLLTGQRIRRNKFLFYNQNPILFRYDSAIGDWIFEYNTIIGGSPTVLGFQGSTSAGSQTVTIQGNTFQYTFTPVGYVNTTESVSKPAVINVNNNKTNAVN
ncbi:hypothetical protein [Xanthocytophaga flava]|uniref:hypothetical protein n=1 Tax=Xanthocytophaga flava TaxID=3048013 RepID=UPI0028CFDFCC|nr:hypothetical protein [Xanthocytophaga flavus]MDJ1467598.1 hypothetical protein [Xanthocytophaga flavus]